MKFGTARRKQAQDYLFYTAIATESGPSQAFDPDYTIEYWRPSPRHLVPENMPHFPFIVWTLFHFAAIFYNRDYSLCLIKHKGQLVHRSVITPGYFRFPFMQPSDLQVGDTWTDPRHRGRGVATHALRDILSSLAAGRRVWYIVENANAPSRRVVEKAGFSYAGAGCRIPRLGLSFFAAYKKVDSTCPY